jgi:Mlc titration factor MtfA (ptsG expression regulator)
MTTLLFIAVITGSAIFLINNKKTKQDSWVLVKTPFPKEWISILKKHVSFYNSLNDNEKIEFENKTQEFLLNCRITGIKTTISDIDKVLVAASAIIPIFGFKEWRYLNLKEVLIYPSSFNHDFETEGDDRRILGMVGNGYMEGKMILSQEALIHGFENESDKKNTAIHEFVHLIDKSGGLIDGIPSLLMEKQYAIPWIDLINKKIDEIYENESDINPYGGTNKAEFFSVASEYFFERPKLLKKKHPQLYTQLEGIFNQDMSSRNLKRSNTNIGRNSPCPCNSGIKFKKCCGIIHYS